MSAASCRSAITGRILTIATILGIAVLGVAIAPLGAQPPARPSLTLASSTRTATAKVRTEGNQESADQGTASAAARQTGREANPCQTPSDADQSVASAAAAVDAPIVGDGTVSLSLTILAEADGGKTVSQSVAAPCTAQSNHHTTASAEAFASVDVTVTLSPAAEATRYEVTLRDPTGSISADTTIFYTMSDTINEGTSGSNPSSADASLLIDGRPGTSLVIHLELKATVSDQNFAQRRAGGTLGLVFDIAPAPLIGSLQPGTERVVGGVLVGDDDYPAVGAVLLRDKVHCSGTLVAPSTVLTAAHCVRNRAIGQMKFVLGTSVGSGAKHVEDVVSGVAHPNYTPATHTADIALLYLKTPIDRNQFEPAPLYDGQSPTWSEFFPSDGMSAFVGFGYSEDGGTGGLGEKRLATMKVRNVAQDSFRYGDSNQNTCYGDSGGPSFFASDTKGRVTGVVSWGDRKCNAFGVNVRADKYRAWITPRLR